MELNEQWDKFCKEDEQLTKECMDIARIVRRVYDSFIQQGFDEDMAYDFTQQYYQEMIFILFHGSGINEEEMS